MTWLLALAVTGCWSSLSSTGCDGTNERAELQRAIIEMAKLLGWRIMHYAAGEDADRLANADRGPSRLPRPGAARPPRLIFAELKSKRGRVDFDQATWLNGLNEVKGVEQYCWRPADWELGTVEEVLR